MRRRAPVATGAGNRGRAPSLLSLWLLCVSVLAPAQSTSSLLLTPSALAYDASGNLYIADANRHQVFEATLAGSLVLIAGTGTQGFAGDSGLATAAELNGPQGLALSGDGTLYIADTGNVRVRAVRAGVIETIAGSGAAGGSGDGASATAALFRSPTALAVDTTGALLVCDTADHRVRRISGGIISAFAGTGVQGFAGDGGLATAAEFDSPAGLTVAPDGRTFIADTHNQRVRLVSAGDAISTFVGSGARGFSGDGGPATAAVLAGPRGLAIDSAGSLLIADADNGRVRGVTTAGVITTVAGSGVEGSAAEGSAGGQAALRGVRAVAASSAGFLSLTDMLNGTVRVLIGAGSLFRPAALSPTRTSSLQGSWAATQGYGQSAVGLAVSGAVGTPVGQVSVAEGGTVLATASLLKGAATLALPALGAGAHTVTATYAGDGLNPSATATSSVLTVTPAAVIATATAATVAYGAALPALTGTLTGVLPQDAGAVGATFAPASGTLAAPGSYPIAAMLTGAKSGNYVLSLGAGSGSLQITQAASATLLNSVPQTYAGLPVRLSAHVSPATSGNPTGAVQFLDGANVVATGTLVNGSASGVYLAPPAGALRLTARYSGDIDFVASTSAPQVAQVQSLPDFGLSAAGSSALTVAAGNIAAYSLVVSAAPAPFTGSVVLSAGGLPKGATVTFSPVQVVPGTGSATVVASFSTPAPQARLVPPIPRRDQPLMALGGLFCCGLLLRGKRRRSVGVLSLGLLLCGCGARTVGEASAVLSSQTYTLQITGTSTDLTGALVTHTVPLTLVVQQ